MTRASNHTDVMNAENAGAFFRLAPVKPEGFAQLKPERHKGGFAGDGNRTVSPPAYKVGHDGVTPRITLFLNSFKQHQAGAPIPLGAACVSFQCHQQHRSIGSQFAAGFDPLIFGFSTIWFFKPFLDGIARQARPPLNLTDCQMFPTKHPAYFLRT
jgi:hypothetical protein